MKQLKKGVVHCWTPMLHLIVKLLAFLDIRCKKCKEYSVNYYSITLQKLTSGAEIPFSDWLYIKRNG